eukprot:TRINITY_DN18064_c0_g1_i4.p1 TRINITY_DN18064_c0_g1~~TRINITY_DN18064_c0_g1_i4.p1  ORF type:complete len:692 (+),score=147.69 TRINITY_DN18064_c0_g1_i4:49-2124(+)
MSLLLLCTWIGATSIIPLSSLETAGYIQDVKVVGDILYAASNTSGLIIFDVSTSPKPRKLATFSMHGMTSIDVAGQTLYTVKGTSIIAIDVTFPEAPLLLSVTKTKHFARGIMVDKQWAYVVGDGGVTAFDVRNPSKPIEGSSYLHYGEAYTSVFASGNIVSACSSMRGDIVNFGVTPPRRERGNNVRGVCRGFNGTIYVSLRGIVILIDVMNPASWAVVAISPSTEIHAFAVWDHYVATTGYHGLYMLNQSNQKLDDPKDYIIGHLDSIKYGWQVRVHEDIAYVAEGPRGVQVVDISNISNPTLVGGYNPISADSRDIFAQGGYAYLSGPVASLQVVDISNPKKPLLVGRLYDGTGSSVHAVGATVYVAGGTQLMVIDVSVPSRPVVLGRRSVKCAAVHVVGTTAYVVTLRDGFQILDVSSPSSIKLVNYLPFDYLLKAALLVSNNIAYVVSDRLTLINVQEPTVLGTACKGSTPSGVDVVGTTAYVAVQDGGLQVLDVSDPLQPAVLASGCKGCKAATDVKVHNGTAYLTTKQGMQAVDVNKPRALRLVDTFLNKERDLKGEEGEEEEEEEEEATTLSISDGVAYVSRNGLHVFGLVDSYPFVPEEEPEGKSSGEGAMVLVSVVAGVLLCGAASFVLLNRRQRARSKAGGGKNDDGYAEVELCVSDTKFEGDDCQMSEQTISCHRELHN